MKMSLRRHHCRVLALRLIERGLRTTPVRELTALSDAEIRALYKTLHGRSPPSGDVPSTAALFPTRRLQVQVSLFAGIYRRIGGPGILQHLDAETLIRAYDVFRDLIATTLRDTKWTLDFTGAWVIANDLKRGAAVLKACRDCRVCYLVAENSDLPPTCPYCALRKERKRLRNRENSRMEANEAT